MAITREELYQSYLIEKESKRKMVIQKHVEKIKEAIFTENSLGKTNYNTSFLNESPEYLFEIITELKNIFIDSKISIKETVNNKISIVSLKIDWKI
jgi:hypothetical protein